MQSRPKKCLNLRDSSGVSTICGSVPHDPCGPRKRVTFPFCKSKSRQKGHHFQGWPKIPQFGHLEPKNWICSPCHSAILLWRCLRSSSADIPIIEACDSRNFLRWSPVRRRFLLIPRRCWDIDFEPRTLVTITVNRCKKSNSLISNTCCLIHKLWQQRAENKNKWNWQKQMQQIKKGYCGVIVAKSRAQV